MVTWLRCLIALCVVQIVIPANASAQDTPARELGPFEIDAGGGAWLRPGFAAQLLGTSRQGERFKLVERRLRFKLDVNAADDRLTAKVQVNAAPGALELIDLWTGWRFDDALELRVGQFTVPMTRYRSGSFSTRLLMDWAPTTKFFGGERQRGLEFSGTRSGFDYAAGVFEGTNARASHATGASLLYGLAPTNPSRLVGPDERPGVHPEVVVRAGWSSSKMDLGGWADRAGGPARVHVGLSGAWDTAPNLGHDWQGRAAGEILLKTRGLGLGAIGYAATTRTSNGAHELGALGALLGVSYHTSTGTTVSARAAIIEIGERARQDAALTIPDPIRGEREWGLGARQDLWGDDLQVGADLLLDEDFTNAAVRRAIVGRVLLQLTL